jgi:hypothetical protein
MLGASAAIGKDKGLSTVAQMTLAPLAQQRPYGVMAY